MKDGEPMQGILVAGEENSCFFHLSEMPLQGTKSTEGVTKEW